MQKTKDSFMITKELMMIKVCRVCAYVTGAAIVLVMLMASKPVEEQGFTPRPKLPPNAGATEKAQDADRPIIPRLGGFKGDIFNGRHNITILV